MNKLINLLVSPASKESLRLNEQRDYLVSGSGELYPIIRGIPRFVDSQYYSKKFGFQWNRFRKTQLDSYVGKPISRQYLLSMVGWNSNQFKDKLVLEVGCGAGRFSEVFLELGARVCAFDLSTAVEANYANNFSKGSILVVQADVYKIPFPFKGFDLVFCRGIIQHTPHPSKTFTSIARHVKRGGRLALDVYRFRWDQRIFPIYWFWRPFFKPLKAETALKIIQKVVDLWWPYKSFFFSRNLLRAFIHRFFPFFMDHSKYGLSDDVLREWSYLDTFDLLTSWYDIPQNLNTVYSWLKKFGFQNIEVSTPYHIVARGDLL